MNNNPADEDEIKNSHDELYYQQRIHQLESLLQSKTQQLEELVNELEDFSFSISHDLKAPLRAIAGFATILKEEQAERLDAEGNRVIGIIEANTKKLTDMINNLLTYSSVSKKQVNLSPVNMKALAMESLAALMDEEEKQNICAVVSNIPFCMADEKMIKHVWLNLLNYVLMSAFKNNYNHIEVGFEEDANTITYIISATLKKGISQQPTETPAKNNQQNSHVQMEGGGAGSAFIKRVLFKHGGNFWIQATPYDGSAYYFSLPK